MRPSPETDLDQGGLEQVSTVDRVAALTGVRAVAALSVMGTHAAYGTGTYNHGYVGLIFARMDIGVAVFFVLSGFLLFRPWVRAAADGTAAPSVRRYARNRVRRIMPAYVVTVLAAYGIYAVRELEPNPGHTWVGLLRNLTLTQIYSDDYLTAYAHQGLTQMWSLAVEVAFYAALPVLAWLLLVVLARRRWRPVPLLTGLGVLAVVSPLWVVVLHRTDWLPLGAGFWLPHYLIWFVGGMVLAVLQAQGVRAYAAATVPVAVAAYLIVATPIAGDTGAPVLNLGQDLAKVMFYAVIATLVVAPPALGNRGWYTRMLGSRPMVWLGEISYEIFLVHVIVMEIAMVSVLRWPVYTGSVLGLFATTLALTIPVAWLLHRFTRPPIRPAVPARSADRTDRR
ncbi:acyltransferase family protein [Mycolicibacterium thermoresistibile]|uniref:Acyltransferase n=2 Tax=Mycolicibacterium thermoresistibile TaxID=1797 RepID=G7CFH7_MYCT3|nr:acyltransferase [Mycolicibacterium thermoresistibile]EHI13256.1 acyltransferase [Mycolicibacterium thermoresistibile ATCC 19527]GAT13105.1 acyltransferase 3 [Mycolicibacterium thermoresistibile]SNW20443.1 acyltransferase 3 [Mycolicibacterium thermoresistibile]